LRQHDNSFFGDPVLFRLASGLSAPILPELAELGAYAASDEAENRARCVARHRPLLRLYDNNGERCEEMDVHPAYHSLVTRARHAGIASSLFEEGGQELPVRHQARAMRLLLLSGVECATSQELCLASAALGLIHTDKALCAEWKPVLISRIHDPLPKPYPTKQSASLSFALHDVEGLQQVQALSMNEAGQTPSSPPPSSAIVRLYGRKSAVINPLADGFLVRALFEGKQSLFLVPRLLGNGKLNGIRAFPTSQSERGAPSSCADLHFQASRGWHLGPVGAAEILLHHAQTQIQSDVTIIRLAQMRRALRLAVDRMRHDAATGQRSEITALQARILADVALDLAAATLLVLRVARAFDGASNHAGESRLAQFAPPLVDAWVARLGGQVFECTCSLASPASKQTEGNFAARMRQALDMECGFNKTPLQHFIDAVDILRQNKTSFTSMIADWVAQDYAPPLLQALQQAAEDPSTAVCLAEQFSYALAATNLRLLDMEIVTSAFIASRMGGRGHTSYGSLSAHFNPTFILETLAPSA